MSWLWCCFGRTEHADQERVETGKHASHESNRNVVPNPGNDCAVQPQPRPESRRIRSERDGETTTSGEWFASAMKMDTVKNEEPPVLAPPANAETKKRKRSLSHVLARRATNRRPMTAPGRSHPAEWRVSLRSLGPSSPFPDFSAFQFEPVVADDNRSSCTYVDALSRRASQLTPADWPLPNNPSRYPLLETGNRSDESSSQDVAEPDLPQPHTIEQKRTLSKTAYLKQKSSRRARALSEPFRHVRRSRPSTSQNDSKDINDEIQELQVLVEARRAALNLAPAHQSRLSGIGRVKSRGHVPAIAPSMKVSVRSQILSDIGSALSKPLPSEKQTATEKMPELDSSNVADFPPVQERSSSSRFAERTIGDVPARAIGHKFEEDRAPSTEPSISRSSTSSIATTASDVSMSHFPTAPSTPPLSMTSPSRGNKKSTFHPSDRGWVPPPPPTRKAPAAPHTPSSSRSSNFVTEIWTAARDSMSLDVFHSRSSSKIDMPAGRAIFRSSDIKPPPPLKATLRKQK